MGLLSKTTAIEDKNNLPSVAEKVFQIKESNNVGLLKKSEILLSKANRLDFFNFINIYKFSSCAIFSKYDDFYLISNSFGFDGKSIITSLSTISFWEGTIQQDRILYNFSLTNNTISPFYQFLTPKQKETVKSIFILKEDSNILFICFDNENETISDKIIQDFSNLQIINNYKSLGNKEYLKIKINKAVENFILSQNILSYNFNYFKNSISNAILIEFSKAFNQDLFISDNFEILISKDIISDLPEALLINHIKLNLKNIIGEYTEDLEFNFQCN